LLTLLRERELFPSSIAPSTAQRVSANLQLQKRSQQSPRAYNVPPADINKWAAKAVSFCYLAVTNRSSVTASRPGNLLVAT
jgi:hypothetical protein